VSRLTQKTTAAAHLHLSVEETIAPKYSASMDVVLKENANRMDTANVIRNSVDQIAVFMRLKCISSSPGSFFPHKIN